MTQEEKELLLKDLCARLPYGVIMQTCNNMTEKLCSYMDIQNLINLGWKPYLRPMSSMTKEEKEEIESISKRWIEFNGIFIWPNEGNGVLHWNTIEVVLDWLIEHHFDCRGLIEKGLALEAPEEMYKN